MKRPIFLKIFGSYFLIILTLSSIILGVSFNTITEHYRSTIKANLGNICLSLKPAVSQFISERRFEELDSFIKEFGKRVAARLTVIDLNGVVLADSESQPSMMDDHSGRPEIIQALASGVGVASRYSFTVDADMLYVAIPIIHDKKDIGTLRASVFLKDISILLGELKYKIWSAALLIIILSLLGALWFSRSLALPIRELNAASGRVAVGDFSTKVLLRNKDELGGLAKTFNYMTGQIKSLFETLSQQKDELNSIISSLQQGLVVLDKNGIIVLCNDSFEDIIASPEAEGRHYWELMRQPRLNELINKVMANKATASQEIEFNDKKYICGAAFIEQKQEAVVIFHDVTQMKQLEKIKKDFVVNVSHELRTPLTAIKGFAETLREGADKQNEHFLDIIARHTERMIAIVNDLLALSALENSETELERSKINMRPFLEDIFKLFYSRAKLKHIDLSYVLEYEPFFIDADAFKLEQIFINLIDNAINYTENGKIVVILKRKNSQSVIIVSDTGIGIAQEHLERIFERFYVVDKSRSRKAGGTGLGLSIVKHIVLLHNGTIEAESQFSSGTKFIISLPS